MQTNKKKNHQVQFVWFIYSGCVPFHWSLADLTGATPLKSTKSSSQKPPTAKSLWVTGGVFFTWAWAGVVHSVSNALLFSEEFPLYHIPPLSLRRSLTLRRKRFDMVVPFRAKLTPFPMINCGSLLITLYWQSEAQRRVFICLTQAGMGNQLPIIFGYVLSSFEPVHQN